MGRILQVQKSYKTKGKKVLQKHPCQKGLLWGTCHTEAAMLARFNSPIKYNFLLFRIWFPLGMTLGEEQKHQLVNGGRSGVSEREKQAMNCQFHFAKFKVRPKLERGRMCELDN